MEYPLVKAVIDLDAIACNLKNLKNMTSAGTKFMAVVKADGYGHGAVRVAEKAIASGADRLGVARFEEALPLRESGISAPILVFGYVHPSNAALAAENNLTLTVYNLEMARALSEQALAAGVKLPIHIKVDTGMGRVGMIVSGGAENPRNLENPVEAIKKITALPALVPEGIYTHFAAADEKDRAYTLHQIDLFKALLADLRKQGVQFKLRHAANSAGIIGYPESHLDMVRAGISLYGLYPSPDVDKSAVILKPAMELVSVVTAVRDVPKGFCVSYGMTFKTDRKTRLASVPIGYADGFSRQFSSNGSMLVKGRRAPIVGRVCMDQTMIDVGHIKGVQPGDEVIVFGCRENEVILADELAANASTINYEIVSALTARVKKIYK